MDFLLEKLNDFQRSVFISPTPYLPNVRTSNIYDGCVLRRLSRSFGLLAPARTFYASRKTKGAQLSYAGEKMCSVQQSNWCGSLLGSG